MRRPPLPTLPVTILFAIIGVAAAAELAENPRPFNFQPKDTIALAGGANVVSEQEHGYFEVLIRAALPDRELRVRNLGWEGDTVYAQPRELNFGSWADQFKKSGATVIVAQFGQMESLQGTPALPQFISAYEKLLDEFSRQTRRIVLVSPVPFERGSPPLPDLSTHNDSARAYADAIRRLAEQHNYFFVDLFNPLRKLTNATTLTSDGVHLNQAGHWTAASESVRQLAPGMITPSIRFDQSTGLLNPAAAEQLRQSILARNRLWFDYWRPMNWAFLAGDRTEQPSSRDHRDPKLRWFPVEMEEYLPLIEARERDLAAQATALAHESR